MSKLQIGIVGAIALAGAAGYVAQAKTQRELRDELVALRMQQRVAAALRAQNRELARAAADVELLRGVAVELNELARKVADLTERRTRARRAAQEQLVDAQVQAEIERMNREGNELVKDYKALLDRAKDAALSQAERKGARAVARERLEQVRAKQREIQAYLEYVRAVRPAAAEANRGKFTFRPESPQTGAASASGDEPRVSMRLAGADLATALSAYETLADRKVARDPLLTGVSGAVDLSLGATPKEEALRLLAAALRAQFGVVVETGSDGSLVARRATTP